MIEAPSEFEPMTLRLLTISVELLMRYFGHTRDEAEELTNRFLRRRPSETTEDFIHDQMPWRIAAAVHYLESIGGPNDGLETWLIESGNQNSPPEVPGFVRWRMR